MTLKTRNRMMQIFFYFSLVCIASALFFFIIALVNKAITPPPNLRIPAFMEKIGFLKYSFIATMISISLVVFFAPVTVFYALKLFENTQSNEIIFFLPFNAHKKADFCMLSVPAFFKRLLCSIFIFGF